MQFRISQRRVGQLGSLFTVATIITVLLIAALGVDSIHMVCARRQLQNAADAAALAGAMNLYTNISGVSKTVLAVAAKCTVEGKYAVNSPQMVIDVSVLPPGVNEPGRVTVIGRSFVTHFLMPLMGRAGDWVAVRAVAGPSGGASEIPKGTCFPLAVSWDTVPNGNGDQAMALSQMHLGDTFRLYIGSQKYKNAAFTSLDSGAASAKIITNAIDQILGLSTIDQVPAVKVGDEISLNNGVAGQKQLAGDTYSAALLSKEFIILPVISGDPPFNQHRKVRGFVAMKVTRIDTNGKGGVVETITGMLKEVAIKGGNGGTVSPDVGDLSVRSIRLLE